MMIVTEIVELSKKKVRVCVDDDICFALYKSELGKLAVEKDVELSQETYDRIMNEVLPKRAKLRCMNLLKSRDYTEYQLAMKLRQGLYPEEIIDGAVAYVASYGYVDDIRYARSYIECAGRSKSRRQIENELTMRKGISKENVRRAYAQCSEDDSVADEEEVIHRLLEKKHFDRQNATDQECRRMAGFLYRRGFEPDKIYRAIGLC